MSSQEIKLLHVEDNVADRLLMARLLGQMKDYTFNIVRAATEITAIAELNKGGIDFIILDYRLPLGDGLNCLRKLRQLDAVLPIFVVSGVTTPELSVECKQAGADEVHSKQDLTADKLANSVRKALSRAGSWPTLCADLGPLSKVFLNSLDRDFFKALNEYEQALRKASVQPEQVALLFETVATHLADGDPKAGQVALQKLRPMMLELAERLRPPAPVPPKSPSPSRPG